MAIISSRWKILMAMKIRIAERVASGSASINRLANIRITANTLANNAVA
ncbi:MAG: hypothetical protein BWZ07_03338 [Alphaproteobacteria bacterium ADurb.BinA280]|nr:MAG: hypothetical protein BWZ07_03338 [Alphaproteobacteria bacterium ADurb.BinA280]